MDKIKIKAVKNYDEIKDLGSALTWEGLTIDDQSLNDMFDWIERHTEVLDKTVYVTKGQLINQIFELEGDNKYPDDLNIVSVKLEDLKDFRKLITARLEVGGRWMDDIIDNLR